ncbi:hypothetical protein MCEZLEM10_00324 [Methylophilaceae bacterium]
MTTANINRYIQYLSESLSQLEVDVPMMSIERIAMSAHSAMENKRRVYHSSKHVFDMCEGMNARQTLAALFHDMVYYQIDGGFPHNAGEILSPVIHFEDALITLNPIDQNNLPVKLCAEVFAFEPGQNLNVFGGLNEFLSAIVAATLLAPLLKKTDLLAVVVIIEATIPFRKTDESERGFIADLSTRIKKICHDFNLFDSEASINEYIDEVLIEAITLSNRDVGGFAESNHGNFLSSTWELIEESNAPLSAVSFYTIQDYRGSLLRMERFLSGLKANQIFHRYSNSPSKEKLSQMHLAAGKNIAFSCHYLSAKITAIAIIEALALETGGNCPVSMLLGDINCDHGKPDRAEDFLPKIKNHPDLNLDLLYVLEGGRGQESKYDLTSSPLTAFVYRSLGDENMAMAFDQANKMFNQEISCIAFLKSLNPELVSAIIKACSQIAISRAPQLQALTSTINSNH